MQINKHNLTESLPAVQLAIDEADFLSLDLEFTGLPANPLRIHSPSARYELMRPACQEIQLIQLGLCACSIEHESNNEATTAHVHAKSFNFNVFPSSSRKPKPFVWQPGSIQFLAEHNFDFNALVREGIGFLNQAEREDKQKYINRLLTEIEKPDQVADIMNISKRDREFMDGLCDSIAQWIHYESDSIPSTLHSVHICSSESNENSQSSHAEPPSPESPRSPRSPDFPNVEVEVETDSGEAANVSEEPKGDMTLDEIYARLPHFETRPLNSYQRRLVFQEMRTQSRFACIAVETLKKPGTQLPLRLTLCPTAQLKEDMDKALRALKVMRIKEECQQAIGVSHIFEMIKRAKKPLIGHNCLLDILHIFDKFDAPLPERCAEFKDRVHAAIPRIFDTRFLSREHPWLLDVTGVDARLAALYEATAFKPCFDFRVRSEASETEAEPEAENMSVVGETGDTERQVDQIQQLAFTFDIAPGFEGYRLPEATPAPKPVISTALKPGELRQDAPAPSTDDRSHEAGFDALQTAYVFAKMVTYLVNRTQREFPSSEPLRLTSNMPQLAPYMNRLPLFRSNVHFHIAGEDDPTETRNAFHLSDFPAEWRQPQIARLFDFLPRRPFFDWIDDTSLLILVQLDRPTQTSDDSASSARAEPVPCYVKARETSVQETPQEAQVLASVVPQVRQNIAKFLEKEAKSPKREALQRIKITDADTFLARQFVATAPRTPSSTEAKHGLRFCTIQ